MTATLLLVGWWLPMTHIKETGVEQASHLNPPDEEQNSHHQADVYLLGELVCDFLKLIAEILQVQP